MGEAASFGSTCNGSLLSDIPFPLPHSYCRIVWRLLLGIYRSSLRIPFPSNLCIPFIHTHTHAHTHTHTHLHMLRLSDSARAQLNIAKCMQHLSQGRTPLQFQLTITVELRSHLNKRLFIVGKVRRVLEERALLLLEQVEELLVVLALLRQVLQPSPVSATRTCHYMRHQRRHTQLALRSSSHSPSLHFLSSLFKKGGRDGGQ